MKRFSQADTPFASALIKQADRDTVNLMVPGHGATNEGLSAGLAAFCGERALEMDIPPLIDGIDVGPKSPFVVATKLAAEAWDAQRTWFLANGASQANRMATLAIAARNQGDTLIAQRSAHSSFTDGILLGDLLPLFVLPSLDRVRGINHGLTTHSLELAFSQAKSEGRRIAAVYIISPSYFGAVADIGGLAQIAHSNDVPLIVDGAWGSHFGFHEGLPESPTRLGADLIVSSTHKLGGSLTQSAMLHLGRGPYSSDLEPLLDRAFMMTQSTSASALLLGSLDVARHALVAGKHSIGKTIAAVEDLRERLRADGRYFVVSDGFHVFEDIVAHDPLRISIDVSTTGETGHQIREILSSEFGVFLEISTASAIVAFIGPGKHPDLARFADALFRIADRYSASKPVRAPLPRLPEPGPMAMRPRSAFFSSNEVVNAADAVGRVSADSLAAYPPGIPNVIPGETITHEVVAFLQSVAASPIGYVRGALDSEASRFRVVADPTD